MISAEYVIDLYSELPLEDQIKVRQYIAQGVGSQRKDYIARQHDHEQRIRALETGETATAITLRFRAA